MIRAVVDTNIIIRALIKPRGTVGPILSGGPALLVNEYNVPHDDAYVDACHLCYSARKALLDRFPEYLTPRQVYGVG